MIRTFSIREAFADALRQFKNNWLFFLGISVISGLIFIVCGFVASFVLSYVGYVFGETPIFVLSPVGYIFSEGIKHLQGDISRNIGIQLALFLPVAFLALLIVALTVVTLRVCKVLHVSYRDLLIKPRILIMGVIALFEIGIGLSGVTLLFDAPIEFGVIAAARSNEFSWAVLLLWGSVLVKALLIGRIILSLFVVANTQGRELNPITRSIELTKRNTIKSTILVALLFFIPMIIGYVHSGIIALLVLYPVFFYFIIPSSAAIIQLGFLMVVFLVAMIFVLWLAFCMLIVSHVYKQLRTSDDAQAAMPSAFIN